VHQGRRAADQGGLQAALGILHPAGVGRARQPTDTQRPAAAVLHRVGQGGRGHVGEIHPRACAEIGAVEAIDQVDHRPPGGALLGYRRAQVEGIDAGQQESLGAQRHAVLELRQLRRPVLVATGLVDAQLHAETPRLLVQAPGHAPPVAILAVRQQGADAPGPLGLRQRPVLARLAVDLHRIGKPGRRQQGGSEQSQP
jgi:hypothetical protein